MEINPNHAVTQELRQQWHKLAAFILFKSGKSSIDISCADMERFTSSGYAAITARPKDDVITLTLVSDEEARRLARKEGGLPV